MIELEKLNVRLGTWSQRLAPGYSWCAHCETPWLFVAHHDTDYRSDRGIFVLCEKCWAEFTPQQRLPYYRQRFDHWKQNGYADEQEWQDIEASVLAGG
jgi:hypothetical protein